MRIFIADIPWKKNIIMIGTPWLYIYVYYVAKYNRYSPVSVIIDFLFRISAYRSTSIFSHRIRSRNTYLIITVTGEKRTWHFAKHKIPIMADFNEKNRETRLWINAYSQKARSDVFFATFLTFTYSAESLLAIRNLSSLSQNNSSGIQTDLIRSISIWNNYERIFKFIIIIYLPYLHTAIKMKKNLIILLYYSKN